MNVVTLRLHEISSPEHLPHGIIGTHQLSLGRTPGVKLLLAGLIVNSAFTKR